MSEIFEAREVRVANEDAIDWLVRSALPRFLSLVSLEAHASYFSALEPFKGFTPSGRISGWQGTGAKLAEADDLIDRMLGNLIRLSNRLPEREVTEMQTETRRVISFASRKMLPSRLGVNAKRTIFLASHLSLCALHLLDDGLDEFDEAWEDVFRSIADRAVLRELHSNQ